MHFYDIVQVFHLGDGHRGLVLLERATSLRHQELLHEIVCLHGSCSCHEVVIKSLNKVQKLPLKNLKLVQKLTKHDSVLQHNPLKGAHLFDLLLVVFGVSIG